MSSEWVYSLADISAGFSIQQTLSQQAQLQSLKPFQFYVQYWDSFDERLNREGIRLWTEEQHDRQFKFFSSTLPAKSAVFRLVKLSFGQMKFLPWKYEGNFSRSWNRAPLLPHLRIQRKRTSWNRKNMEGKKSPFPAAGAGSGVLPADPISWRRGNRDKIRIDSSMASGRPGSLQRPGAVQRMARNPNRTASSRKRFF
ncbi:MAG: hypothetical protein ACJ0DI_00300 [bacterium]